MRLPLVPLLLLVLVAPALAQGHGEERRTFTDWLGACRADGYCSAMAYVNANPGNGTVADYVLRIGRHAEQSYWEISFTTVAAMADPDRPVDIAVDGEVETFRGIDEIAAYGAINDFFLTGPKAQAVMDRLAPGAELAVEFEDTGGAAQSATFSLSGLTAALIWIDEQQRRLGSERVAEVPPFGLDPARPMPPEADAVPAALLAQHAADTDCQPMDEIANGEDIEIDLALAEATKLYILPCWSAAYNFGWRAYLERFGGGTFEIAAFAQFEPSHGWTATTTLINYSYDAATKTITTFGRGRGYGDCGTRGTWRWHELGFQLVEFRSKQECDWQGEPGDFPVVYERDEP